MNPAKPNPQNYWHQQDQETRKISGVPKGRITAVQPQHSREFFPLEITHVGFKKLQDIADQGSLVPGPGDRIDPPAPGHGIGDILRYELQHSIQTHQPHNESKSE